ncbi:MAG: cob(I)yrinic acid a,c-diamide adenosyltransferase [Candidatus Nanopelagicales bacterium]
MVHLTRIYTRTGDDGSTGLGDFTRVHKSDARLDAFADVDEANSALGVAVAMGELDADVSALISDIQNDLFDVGADLCTPLTEGDTRIRRIDASYVARLETACDQYNQHLGPLDSFILPGGTAGASLLHVARTVVRRAERATWAAVERYGATAPGGINVETAKYLNRLSDLLFILARYANLGAGDVLWRPGGGR